MLITSKMILDAKELHEYIWGYVYKQAEFQLYNMDEFEEAFPICDWKADAIRMWERKGGAKLHLRANCVLCQMSNKIDDNAGTCSCKFCEKMGFVNVSDAKLDCDCLNGLWVCLNGLWEDCFEATEEGLEAIRKIRDLFKERGI